MKIDGNKPPAPPVASDAKGVSAPGEVGQKPFAPPVDAAQGGGAAEAESASQGDFYAELSARVERGELSPSEVRDLLVERVLDEQLGPNAPAELRAQAAEMLVEVLETDPHLGDLLRKSAE